MFVEKCENEILIARACCQRQGKRRVRSFDNVGRALQRCDKRTSLLKRILKKRTEQIVIAIVPLLRSHDERNRTARLLPELRIHAETLHNVQIECREDARRKQEFALLFWEAPKDLFGKIAVDKIAGTPRRARKIGSV